MDTGQISSIKLTSMISLSATFSHFQRDPWQSARGHRGRKCLTLVGTTAFIPYTFFFFLLPILQRLGSPDQAPQTSPARRRWCRESRLRLCGGNKCLPCWRTCKTCSSLIPGGRESWRSPNQSYSWQGQMQERWPRGGQRYASTNRCKSFTWEDTGTDPGWARREPGTLSCSAGGGCFHGSNVQQLPEDKNTQLCC